MMLDEPTAALGVHQTQTTLEVIRSVAGQGIGVIVISHSIEDVFAVADRIVVLRLGRVVLDTPAADDDLGRGRLGYITGGLGGDAPVSAARRGLTADAWPTRAGPASRLLGRLAARPGAEQPASRSCCIALSVVTGLHSSLFWGANNIRVLR